MQARSMLSTNTINQISTKGALETLRNWKTGKTNKQTPKLPLKNTGIFNIVMTPDRIPKFFIPSLDVDHVFLQLGSMEETKDLEKEEYLPDKSPRTKRSHSESYIKRLKGEDLWRKEFSSWDMDKFTCHSDPPTKAALSLPHLPKFTTPYGFLTIGESPNIRRKESLFFGLDSAEPHPLLPQRKKDMSFQDLPSSPSRKPKVHQEHMMTLKKPSRSFSWEVVCNVPVGSSSNSSSSEDLPGKGEKKKIQLLMKKHFLAMKCIRSSGENSPKLPVTIGRTQSNPIT